MSTGRLPSAKLRSEHRTLLGRQVRRQSTARASQWMVLQWPHLHGDLPPWLDGRVPDLFEDELALGALEVVVAFLDVCAEVVDVFEGLGDEALHLLDDNVS